MKKKAIIIFLWILTLESFSQINWINFKNSGQYNDAFSSIAFDENNNPWAGTLLNGVHYFNGNSFQNFNTLNSPILHDKIYDLLYDKQENQLIIATLKGLTVYKENVWTNYTMENSNLPSNAILSLAKDEGGRIWFGTDKGVVDGLNGIVYNSNNTKMKGDLILHICIDSKGNKWFATNKEIARFDGESWQIFSSENSILPNESALCIEEDANGIIWASLGNTYSGTLAYYNGNLWTLIDEGVLSNLSSRISSIITFDDGTNWFGTHDKGLIQYKDSVWTAYSTSNSGIPINQLISMKSDWENQLWLAHRNGLTKVVFETVVSADVMTEKEFLILPNPMLDVAKIIVPQKTGEVYQFIVTNMNGQIVRRENNISANFVFERKDLNSGVYLLKLYNAENTVCRKIVLK